MPERMSTIKRDHEYLVDPSVLHGIVYGFDSSVASDQIVLAIDRLAETPTDPRSLDVLLKVYEYALFSWKHPKEVSDGNIFDESLRIYSHIDSLVVRNARTIAKHIVGDPESKAERTAISLFTNALRNSLEESQEYLEMMRVVERKWKHIQSGYEQGYGEHENLMFEFLDDKFSERMQLKAKKKIAETINEGTLEVDFHEIARHLIHGTRSQRGQCKDIILQFLEQRGSGMPIHRCYNNWLGIEPEETYDGRISREEVIQWNLAAVAQLHKFHPNSLKVLYHMYGITHFGRYPLNYLTDMVSDFARVNKQPYVLLIDAKTDWNGSFYTDKEEPVIQNLQKQLQDLGYALRIVEVPDILAGEETLRFVTEYFGKASGAIVRTHSNKTSLSFTRKNEQLPVAYTLTSRMLSHRYRYQDENGDWIHVDGYSRAVNFFRDNFHPNSHIVFRSCLANHIRNMTQAIEESGMHCIASNKQCSIEALQFTVEADELQIYALFNEIS